MNAKLFPCGLILAASLALSASIAGAGDSNDGFNAGRDHGHDRKSDEAIQLGPRPFYLVQGMDSGKLKDKLLSCQNGPFRRTDFSIGHRGAALEFPEHTKEAYQAGARMGAGIVECDVTFTKDGELVCRHDECDLATTTNIVTTPLNSACTTPWSGAGSAPKCCTSDLTLAQFRTLRGKMDASTPSATTAEGFLRGTASWRTDLYTGRGTLMTLRESIALNRMLGVKHTPELKAGNAERIAQVFGGQNQYAQAMIDEFKRAGVDP
ncbi:MAG TPA: glycerophosphodiester phosphodiesterase family protein, partial [Povalibacter sp.]|nr:glycerophosphodiester phosphodiesterase family protein [Povalibacter sp.]